MDAGIMNTDARSKFEVREMEIDDLACVFHLGERLFTSRKVPTLYRTWDEYEVTNIFQTEPEFCLVAEVDQRIIGFALGTTITKTRSAWKYGHLVWLGIDPEYQHSGVATRLFGHFRSKMEEEGVRILLVDTEADNKEGLAFFQKMGFGSPEEHLYLALNLDQQQPRQTRKRQPTARNNAYKR
jgi:ribosomal protein S18 acetylase RimI-like enzyme